MDIKPGNIFICRESMDDCSVHHDSDDGFDELDDDYGSVTYKIGDLGHVTSVVQPIVEEEAAKKTDLSYDGPKPVGPDSAILILLLVVLLGAVGGSPLLARLYNSL